MKSSVFALVIGAACVAPVAASAQSVDQLLADHALLRTELDHCKQMGLASNDDPRCRTARAAEQQRFFGDGKTTYTQRPVTVTPGEPEPPTSAPQTGQRTPHG